MSYRLPVYIGNIIEFSGTVSELLHRFVKLKAKSYFLFKIFLLRKSQILFQVVSSNGLSLILGNIGQTLKLCAERSDNIVELVSCINETSKIKPMVKRHFEPISGRKVKFLLKWVTTTSKKI